MSLLTSRVTQTIKSIGEMFQFANIKGDYKPMYHYTILKSIHSLYTLLSSDKEKVPCFDYESIDYKHHIDRICFNLERQLPIIRQLKRDIISPFICVRNNGKYSEDPIVVFTSLISCYMLFASAVVQKMYKKELLDENSIIYLPFEQECTLGYFINRYINQKEIISPETMQGNEETKLQYYKDIHELTSGIAESQETLPELYAHSKKTSDNKRKIMQKDLVIGTGEDFTAYTLNDIVLTLLKLDNKNIRVQKLVESPSAETMPFLGYSALQEKTAQVVSCILEYIPQSTLYQIFANSFEAYFEMFEELRILDKFTESIYFADKYRFFNEYIEILSNNSASITPDRIPSLMDARKSYVEEPADPFEELLYSVLLLKVSSYVKQKAAIIRYILENKDAFTCNITNHPSAHSFNELTVYFDERKDMNDKVFRLEEEILNLSSSNAEAFREIAYKIYFNLWGQPGEVSFIDHLACCQIVKLIKDKKDKKFKEYNPLNFYERRTQHGIFKEQYDYEAQGKSTLSSIIKHDKFTTEDCVLIEMLIDTQKYCFYGIDIFSVYREILAVLDVLEYALTFDKLEYAASPYRHLKAGEAVLNEWGKVIPTLVDYFDNKLNIPVEGKEELKKLRF